MKTMRKGANRQESEAEQRPLRVGAYARVSTTNQLLEHDSSLDTQLSRIRQRIDYETSQATATGAREWVLATEYREEGKSGKNIDRPALQQLLADVRDGKLDAVVVVKIDRITRSLIDFYELWSIFEEHEVEFFALDDKFETASATGRAMLKITLVFAELERERTSERTKEKIQSRMVQGLWFGGRVPFGYKAHDTNKTTLLVDEKKAEILRKDVFEKFIELGSARAVAKYLAQRGIKRERAPFAVQTVLNALRDQGYVAKRRLETGEVIDCNWPPLIDAELFARVQAKLALNTESPPKRRGSSERVMLLEGLLRCGGCGSMMTRSTGTGRNGAHFYYRCTLKHRTAQVSCKTKDIPASAVENFVLDQISQLSIDAKALKDAVREANEGRDDQLSTITDQLKKVASALQQVGMVINGLVDSVESGGDVKALVVRLREKERDKAMLEGELAELKAKRDALSQKMMDAEVVAESYQRLPALFAAARKANAANELRQLLREVVDVIDWRPEAGNPKAGQALIQLYELPPGFWSDDTSGEKKRPNAPMLSGSLGRQHQLPE